MLTFKLRTNTPYLPEFTDLLTITQIPTTSKQLLLLQKNTPIGILIFQELFPDIEILDFVILETRQNKGYGKMLLEHFEEYAKENAYKRILLDVHEHNLKAQYIYEKMGFSQNGERENYYDGKFKAILMEKNLS